MVCSGEHLGSRVIGAQGFVLNFDEEWTVECLPCNNIQISQLKNRID